MTSKMRIKPRKNTTRKTGDNANMERKQAGERTKPERLTGSDAIEHAEANGLPLCKYNDPIEDAREDLTVSEAEAVAQEDPSLIYIDVDPPAEKARKRYLRRLHAAGRERGLSHVTLRALARVQSLTELGAAELLGLCQWVETFKVYGGVA